MAKPMTKTQLVAAIAEAMKSDKKSASAALDAIAEIVAREVSRGGAVTLPGIGKVTVRARPARAVRNPATGETMTRPSDTVVKVTISRALTNAASGRGDDGEDTDDPGPMIR